MTKEVFFKEFERHLLVGSPKREEILAELKTHMDELRAVDAAELGNPKSLARQYNRTHVGLLGSRIRMFGFVTLTGLLLGLLDFANWIGWKVFWRPDMSSLSSLRGHVPVLFLTLSDQKMWLQFVFPLITAFFLGWTLTRVHRSGRLYFFLTATGLFAGTLFGSITSLYQGPSWDNPATGLSVIGQSAWIASVTSLFWLLAAAFGSILAPLHEGKMTKIRRRQLSIQIVIGAGFTYLFAVSFALDFNNNFQIIPGSISLILFVLSLQATIRRLLEFIRARYHSPETQ